MDLYDCLNEEFYDNIDKTNKESRDLSLAMDKQKNILLAKNIWLKVSIVQLI